MNALAEETTIHAEAETHAKGACSCGMHAPDMAKVTEEMTKRFERGFKDAKFAVTDKLEDTRHEAERFVKRGRYAFEDAMTESVHQMKRHPGTTLAVAFAAGAALGFMMPRFGTKRTA